MFTVFRLEPPVFLVNNCKSCVCFFKKPLKNDINIENEMLTIKKIHLYVQKMKRS